MGRVVQSLPDGGRWENLMLNKVLAFCEEHGLLAHGSSIVVAVSGGADSMALLDLLLHLQERLALSVHVAHFEHGIRGEASREDADYVAAFCRTKGVACSVEAADVPQYAKERRMSLETAARELRYAFLRRVKAHVGAQVIAVAHHADDQAETVLQHILRGAGLHGLVGMRPRTGDVVRPLLACTKEELVAYCAAHGIEVRHDATNDAADAQRNYLRLEILPRLAAHVNASAGAALVRLAEAARADDVLLDEMAHKAFSRVVCSEGWEAGAAHERLALSRTAFRAEPLALQRRIVRLAAHTFVDESHDWGWRQVEQVRRMMVEGRGGLSWDLPGRVRFFLDGKRGVFFVDELRTAHKKGGAGGRSASTRRTADGMAESELLRGVPLRAPGVTRLPALGVALVTDFVRERTQTDGRTEVYLPSRVLAAAVVRTRRAGDRVRLPCGKKKLKDFFIDEHVPRTARDRVPLVVCDGEVVWAVGVRRFSSALVKEDESMVRLRAIFEEGAYDHAQRLGEDSFR
ncbi:tRNA lysidine(34) synthetase TilS [Selenomonas sputigena]|uniref:tRNA lysidine(34) synthetase TilS n=1 Tax=Selenomonas sputigena TaxID=69823 RepID=UPI00223469D2|nr:tRNA lysidine(34) synthetase TilS [Selenomonas sputigena]UZE46502.1 tRNA lysidine(34) synthetase TilS [Selenomonas sputigena]